MNSDTTHPMRRNEKAITDHHELETILSKARVCRLAMTTNNTPYIVPMNFGYEDNILYFHCAHIGRKLDMIKINPLVCFEVDIDDELINTGMPCRWTTHYTSIIGYGKASIMTDPEQKREALTILTTHYDPKASYQFPAKNIQNVTIIKVDILSMTGKRQK